MKSLRVLYLVPPGRTEASLSRYSFLDEEIRALADRGVEAFVIASGASLDSGRIHLRSLPGTSSSEALKTCSFFASRIADVPPACVFQLRKCFRALHEERFAAELILREGITLIHSFFARPLGFGGLLAKAATGVPLIAGFRGVDVNVLPALGYGATLDPFYDRAIRRLMRRADATISVSEFVKRDAVALGAPPGRSTVILKGVRLSTFAPRPVSPDAVSVPPMILAVGGLISIKGFRHILDALAIIRAEGLHFRFVACGDGPDRDMLELQASRLGLSDCCVFAGKVPRRQVADYFAAADIFVHGALIEGSGNVLLEAMASGLPVVCTDAGGPAEYVRDGETGFVVPVANARAMADRIALLLRDPSVRLRLGQQARHHTEAHFGYDRMIDEILDVYRSVLTGEVAA